MRLPCGTAAAVIGLCLWMQAPGRAAGPGGGSTATAGVLVERFLSRQDPPLESYRAFRTLEAEARGGRMRARLTAWTTLDSTHGFRYSIVEESGSHLIRQRVLRAALEAERAFRASGGVARAEVTTANYEFGAGERGEGGTVRVDIRPTRHDPMLVTGSILLTAPDADLQQVEGLLSRWPSLWTREVHVVRRYERIAGVRVPVSMVSTARVLAAGHSTFTMTYDYTSVNGDASMMPRVTAAAR